jgi:hypothetical protein
MLPLSRYCLLLLAAGLIAGCGASAAPVNVEGTVQARVSATMGAAVTRPQPSPTRQAASTAIVIPIASSPTALPGTTAVRTDGATPTPTVMGASGTPARSASTPAGTVAIPAGATAVPPLSLGTYARLGGFSATVARYEWNVACPSGGGRASPGAKYVVLQIATRNDAAAALALPPVEWTVGGHLPASGGSCRPEGQALVEACPRTLAPGARCEGWLLFEVPEALEVPGAIVQARAPGGVPDTARWRLPG